MREGQVRRVRDAYLDVIEGRTDSTAIFWAVERSSSTAEWLAGIESARQILKERDQED